MTDPKVSTIKRSGSRFYVDPAGGRKNPGVTSVLNMLPKPFLKFWASKLVAEFAVNNIGEMVGLAVKDPQAAIDLAKRAPDRFTRSAADAGTGAHDLFEKLAKGERIPTRLPADLQAYVDHFREFLEQCAPEFAFMEETVWSDSGGYAGSFDAFMTITKGPFAGRSFWTDWKTTRSGVHEEVALQLSAYANAENIIRPDGSRVPMPKCDGACVVHFRPEGWRLVPVEIGDVTLPDGSEVSVLSYFEALREVFDWDSVVKKHVIGAPAYGGGEFALDGPRINKPRARKAAP